VTERTNTCSYCGEAYELPPEYVSGENKGASSFSHPKDPATGRYTGQIITSVAGVRVHECWRHVPQNAPPARFSRIGRSAESLETDEPI
jgi:hypothetical protein